MIEYKFKIADQYIFVKSLKELNFKKSLLPFITEDNVNPSLVIEIEFDTEKFQLNSDWKEIYKNVFEKDGNIIQRYYWKQDEYIYRFEPIGRGIPCRIGVPKGFAKDFCKNGDILNYLALDRLLLKKCNCVYFHSSFINYVENGIVLSAPSNGGKSTQAKLWVKYKNAELINGDKTLFKFVDNKCIAYGSPIAGTSNIYINKGIPLKLIIFIKKGTCNSIQTLNKIEAYKELYSGMVKSSWDKEYNKKVLEIIEHIVQHIPVAQLICTLDKQAVECVLDYLKGIE